MSTIRQNTLMTVKRTGAREIVIVLGSGQILKMDLDTAQGLAMALSFVSTDKGLEAEVRSQQSRPNLQLPTS